ncbi:MAG: hypothetical protein ACLP5H_30485 [Desulfomonilaceae bacterium]
MAEESVGGDYLRKQAWNYFSVHAGQRLTTFNFYIVISALLSTGLLTTFNKDYQSPLLGLLVGSFLPLFSFVFYKLDERNRELIRGAEAALRFFEDQSQYADEGETPHVTKIFCREDCETEKKKAAHSSSIWDRHFSYSDCLNWVFRSFALIGLTGAVISLTKILKGV